MGESFLKLSLSSARFCLWYYQQRHKYRSNCLYTNNNMYVIYSLLTGFAIGHLVHSVLLITVQVGFIVDGDVDNAECLDILQIVLDVMFPCYCFLQLYFIFKYSNVIILRAQVFLLHFIPDIFSLYHLHFLINTWGIEIFLWQKVSFCKDEF